MKLIKGLMCGKNDLLKIVSNEHDEVVVFLVEDNEFLVVMVVAMKIKEYEKKQALKAIESECRHINVAIVCVGGGEGGNSHI